MAKMLKTNASVWSRVFRRIVQQLENDPDVRRVVGVLNLRSWRGVPGDKAPFEPSQSQPVVRLTPNPSNVDWYSPDLQVGTLAVVVEMVVPSLCVDDVADLWDVLVHALLPGGPALSSGGNPNFAQDLVAAGAETGEIVFSDPAFDPRPRAEPEGIFMAEGRFHLRLLRSVIS
jgi:hypothetical protein